MPKPKPKPKPTKKVNIPANGPTPRNIQNNNKVALQFQKRPNVQKGNKAVFLFLLKQSAPGGFSAFRENFETASETYEVASSEEILARIQDMMTAVDEGRLTIEEVKIFLNEALSDAERYGIELDPEIIQFINELNKVSQEEEQAETNLLPAALLILIFILLILFIVLV